MAPNESETFETLMGRASPPPLPRPPVDTNGLHAQRGGRIRLWVNVAKAMHYVAATTRFFLFSILSTANPLPCG
jgi:hypothetical protein